MLRFQDQIRLTTAEQANFEAVTGERTAPTTVQAHNAVLQDTKDEYDAVVRQTQPEFNDEGDDDSGVAEARLMAAVLAAMQLKA